MVVGVVLGVVGVVLGVVGVVVGVVGVVVGVVVEGVVVAAVCGTRTRLTIAPLPLATDPTDALRAAYVPVGTTALLSPRTAVTCVLPAPMT